jgi:hypothetical protein
MEIPFDVLGAVGLAGTFYFGIRSMFQSSDFEALQHALRAYNQGIYNNLWRMGENADLALKTSSLTEAQQLCRGIADMTHTSRHTLVAFSKEHGQFCPVYESAWEPKPLTPQSTRSWWRKVFWL